MLKESKVVSFYKDEEVIDKIVNLLTEGKSIAKIKGIISSTEIIKYGGDIANEDAEEMFEQIIEWWNNKNETPYNNS